MQRDHVYSTTSTKSTAEFARAFEEAARKKGLVVHNQNTMDMSHTFGLHGVKVAEDFDLHMIQVCNPPKAAQSLSANPERAILMPKFIMTFTSDGATQIRFLTYSEENIKAVVENDDQFPESLAQTYKTIIGIIDEAK